MSARILTLGAALLLGACSTVQENPNYQYSSKYGAPETAPNVQVAAQTTIEPTYAKATIEPVMQDSTTIVANHDNGQSTSPTEQAYNADAMEGTPGYAIFVAEGAQAQPATPAPQSAPQPVPQSAPVSGPRPIAYDYAQNIIVTDEPAARSSTAANVPTASNYTVQPGDTVYSLSRRLCTPITEIMTANGIRSDFGIDIGQTLNLPASRC